jgi:hypothetical protein
MSRRPGARRLARRGGASARRRPSAGRGVVIATALTGLLVVLAAWIPAGSAALTGATASGGQKLTTVVLPAVTGLSVSRPCTLSVPYMNNWDTASGQGSATVNAFDAGVQTNDLLVAFVSERTTGSNILAAITPPLGWNLLDSPTIGVDGLEKVRIAAYWKLAVGGAQSHTFQWTGANYGTVSAAVILGADITSPATTSPIISSPATGKSNFSSAATIAGTTSPVPRGTALLIGAAAVPNDTSLPAKLGTAPNDMQPMIYPEANSGTTQMVWQLTGRAAGSTVGDYATPTFPSTGFPSYTTNRMWASKSMVINPAPPDPKVTLSWTSPGPTYSYVSGYKITRAGGSFTTAGRTTSSYVDATPPGTASPTYAVASQTASGWTSATATIGVGACPP